MKRLILALFFPVILVSCQNDMPHICESNIGEPSLVNFDQAISIAKKANGYISQQTRLNPSDQGINARLSSTRTVSSSFTVKPGNEAASYYIFNYEDGGFAIISGDRRVMPILAFSDENSFPTDADSYPSSIVHWLEGAHLEIQEARLKNIEQTPVIKAAWEQFEKSDIEQSARIKNYDEPDPDPRCSYNGEIIWHATTTVGPLLQTAWGQGDGYNDLCPYLGCPSYANGRTPTGCVATATAQIMRYHSFPNFYSWSSMHNTLPSPATAGLMVDIGMHVLMTFTCNGSYVETSKAVDALTGPFGYSSASYGPYNYLTVLSEIKNYNRPVILKGGRNTGWWIFNVYDEGHAWVCDGTRQTEYYRCYEEWGQLYSTSHYELLHFNMNWGWNGYFNGFFAFNNFNPSSHTFNYKTAQIVNIKP